MGAHQFAPPVDIASTDRAGRIDAMDEIKRALEIAEQIPFRFLVQHLGNPNDAFDEKKFERSGSSCDRARDRDHFGLSDDDMEAIEERP